MLTQDNEDLVRVGEGTPMGRYMSRFWQPACRSEALVAGGAPVRVGLLGKRLVAFRGPDGHIGVLDELCPHRRTSLALGRNEEGGLRCIFHGWKFDINGNLMEVPTEPEERREAFASKVKPQGFPVLEKGGAIWVFLGDGDPPPFPEFEWTSLPPESLDIRIAFIHCNWLQLLEAVLDSAHLAHLHSGQANKQITNDYRLGMAGPPAFEMEETPYGFREAAIRRMPDGEQYVKVREFIAPYYSFIPGFPENPDRKMVMAAVPVDDEWCAQWHFYYNVNGTFTEEELAERWLCAGPDRNSFWDDPGGFHNMWGQDRAAMAKGHFSGFPHRHIYIEDFIVQEAMGRIVDRTKEHLSQSDIAIIFARRHLLAAARQYVSKGIVWGQDGLEGATYANVRSKAFVCDADSDWRSAL